MPSKIKIYRVDSINTGSIYKSQTHWNCLDFLIIMFSGAYLPVSARCWFFYIPYINESHRPNGAHEMRTTVVGGMRIPIYIPILLIL